MANTGNGKITLALSAAQGLLAATYGMFGLMKMTKPVAELAPMMTWVPDFPEIFVRALGAAEVLGAIGLILPGLLRIKPAMVWITACIILAHQCCAVVLHLGRGEAAVLPLNLVLIGLAAFIAWGRKTRARIAPRG